ncbi:MAG: exodeoxyribonuclease VII large subunit [Betaproteobacteria bacterium]|nr:exodeoxyribonuclease VII large subunit [Betaproteobacteria bacterium]
MIAKSELIHSVSAFNRLIQHTLSSVIPLSWVTGEISNFTLAASGHWYFSLKDAQAQVRCVMFRSRNQFVDWQPKNGLYVEVRATAGLFETRGEFQLQVEHVRLAGAGTLFAAFEQLKQDLAEQGLFDNARKRPISQLPRQIGVVTSPQGAALQDVLSTLRRLMPALPVIIYPCQVQGQGAVEQIVSALEIAGRRMECDTLILCRGGGSLEDLWSFNDERVARAIAASPIPVISGVGHETDFTIADFVADFRAPTPTAAASVACTHQEQLRMIFDGMYNRLQAQLQRSLQHHQQNLRLLQSRLVHPGEKLRTQQAYLQQLGLRLREALRHPLERQRFHLEQLTTALLRQCPQTSRVVLEALRHRLDRAMHNTLQSAKSRMAYQGNHLESLNPLTVLARGYSLTTDMAGEVVRDASALQVGDAIQVRFAQGKVNAVVQEIFPK